ncbi:MAG: imidazole glycerol phosphate synthase cyclase subunit [Oligoflexia bacterium]|nr:imidazole glycerol phosphate synthase cyclase subunit [Oligoflexia bacterium]
MLKKRIIPVQLLMNDRLVKTAKFDTHRDVGDPVASSRVYNSQYADELVFLNINRKNRSVNTLLALIEKVSEVCFMPLSFGGGIVKLEDAEQLIKNGADKVIVNSSNYENKNLITQIADKFGAQAAIASIDARFENGEYVLHSNCGTKRENVSLENHVKDLIERGAGEIFINSIDRDGTMTGYDLGLISRVMKCASVPVIACGGAGTYEHMKLAFLETRVSALACGSLFNFGDNNPIRAKAFLSNYDLNFKKV